MQESRVNKYRRVLLLFCGAILTVTGLGSHAFYLSITDIEFFQQEKLVGVTIKVFTDDLENIVESLGAEPLLLGAVDEHPDADRYLARYVDQVVTWKLNGQPVTMNWLGKEVENDVTLIYLEASGINALGEVEVSHRLFLDELETQENIVHLHCGTALVSKRLNRLAAVGRLACE
ncbi:MAG: hypothetical protein NWR72_17685 [Bacteroidia bacterium]|nr:hypothetical protein [Bacteroidia bacterium]